MESVRRKIGSLINLGSNKVSVVRLTTFYNFLKLCLLKSFSKNNLKKWKMLMTKKIFNFVGLRQRVIGSLLLRAFTLCLKSMNNFYIMSGSLDWNVFLIFQRFWLISCWSTQECSLWNSLHFYVDLKGSTPKSKKFLQKTLF